MNLIQGADMGKCNLYFVRDKNEYINFMSQLRNPSFTPVKDGAWYSVLDSFKDIEIPIIQGGVMRITDKEGFEHVRSVSNFYDIIIEKVKP